MQAAKAAGSVTSFDLNYREKLWKAAGGAARAQEILCEIARHVDVLVGNEENLQKGLGLTGPDVTAKSKLDPTVFLAMMETVKKRFPNVKIVATTLREVHSANRHSWSAVAWVDGQTVSAPAAELEVYDRVGGGDGFDERRVPRTVASFRVGAWHASHHVPGRHYDGDPGSSQKLRGRGLRPHSAVVCCTSCSNN